MRNFLLFLSKTDNDILKHCPESTKYHQTAMGAFVLFTGVLAFFSGSFAISNLFLEETTSGIPEVTPIGRIISIVLGTIYAVIIMAIDREIVSATNKWAAAVRIPLALIIGIVIAVPLELKIFEPRILDAIADKKYEKTRTRRFLEVDSLQAKHENAEQRLIDRRESYLDSAAYWGRIMEQEAGGLNRRGRSGKVGRGPRWREAKENKEDWEKRASDLNGELVLLRSRNRKSLNDGKSNIERQPVRVSTDLLQKYITLHEISIADTTNSVRNMSWGITILLVFLELIPSLMKLMSHRTEYDALLEARRRLNIQMAYRSTNTEMQNLEDVNNEEVRSEEFKQSIITAFRSIKSSMMR